jgi:hypothetical protein
MIVVIHDSTMHTNIHIYTTSTYYYYSIFVVVVPEYQKSNLKIAVQTFTVKTKK